MPNNSIAIAEMAVSCISSFSSIFAIIYRCERQIIETIFNALSEYLAKISMDEKFDTEEKVTHTRNLFLTLLVLP